MCWAHKLIVNRRQSSQNHRDSGCQFLQNKAREFMYTKLLFLITLCLKIVKNVPKLLQEKKKKIIITFKTVTKNMK